MGFSGLSRAAGGPGVAAVAAKLVRVYSERETKGGAAKPSTAQHAWDRAATDLAFGASPVLVADRLRRHGDVWVRDTNRELVPTGVRRA